MTTTPIPPDEIHYHPTSFCDRNGRLFSWKGGLYRGLTASGAALCQRMFREGIVDKLVAKKLLIETELTDLTAPGFELVVRHRRLPFVTYPFEWSPRMLHAAALRIADLELELSAYDLTLGAFDTNCWNLLFDGVHPLYIDFGSIFPTTELTEDGYRGFETSCLNPLRLHAAGYTRIAWRLLQDYQSGGIPAEDYAALNGEKPRVELADVVGRKLRAGARAVLPAAMRRNLRACLPAAAPQKAVRLDAIRRLRDEALAIELPVDDEAPDRVSPHTARIEAVLAAENPRSVLTVGDGSREIATLAGRAGRQVVAIDRDLAGVEAQFRSAEKGVQPVWMDIRFPTPGQGVLNRELLPAAERFLCDAVVAPGCVHRLVFENNLRFDQVVAVLGSFARRLLVTEFAFPESPLLRERSKDSFFSWYGADNFMGSLREQFASVEIVETGVESALVVARKAI